MFKNKLFRISFTAVIIAVIVSLSLYTLLPAGTSIKMGRILSIGVERTQAAATITTLGTDMNKDGYIMFYVTEGLAGNTGDLLVVCSAGDIPALNVAHRFYDSSEAQLYDFTQDEVAEYTNEVVSEIFSLELEVDVGDGDYIMWGVVTGYAFAITIYQVEGLVETPLDDTSSATGDGTTGNSSTTGTLAQADEVIIGTVGGEDEIDDMTGTWTTGVAYVSGNEQLTGTNGAGDASNICVYSAAEIVSATTAQQAEVTGMDKISWGACVATYKVSVAEANISNSPSSIAYGVVNESSTNWSNGSEPSWPLTDGDAYFTITNNGAPCSITIKAINFTGGVGWTLTSGAPGLNTVRLTAFKEGDGSGDGIALTTSPQAFISGLVTNIDWEVKLETGTYTDGALKTSTITLAATLD